jgi:hypothetical protein
MEKNPPKYLRVTALKETEGDPYSDLMDELEKSLQRRWNPATRRINPPRSAAKLYV